MYWKDYENYHPAGTTNTNNIGELITFEQFHNYVVLGIEPNNESIIREDLTYLIPILEKNNKK